MTHRDVRQPYNCQQNGTFLTRHEDVFQLCFWQLNQMFLMRLQDIFQPCLWEQKLIFLTLQQFHTMLAATKVDTDTSGKCPDVLLKMSTETNILNETLGHLPTVSLAAKLDISDEMSGHFHTM